jgi:PPOX class probable F420-dependent enzyme
MERRCVLGDEARRLLDAPYPCVLSTLRRNGTPVSTVLWCGRDGDAVTLSAGHDALWLRRVRTNPAVSLAIFNLDDPLDALTITGVVDSIQPDADYSHIHSLSRVYDGHEYTRTTPATHPLFILTIRPERAVVLVDAAPIDLDHAP